MKHARKIMLISGALIPSLTVFVLLMSPQPVMAQTPGICGLLDDGQAHTPPRYTEPLPRPAKGQSYTDPAFGCEIKRLSNGPAEFGTAVHHEYSIMSPFNSNNTRVLLLTESGAYFIADLNGNVIVPPDGPNALGVSGPDEPRWSTSDPNVFFYHQGNQFKQYILATNQHTVLRTFSEYASISFGTGSSDISDDGDHLAIYGHQINVDIAVFVYKISTNVKYSPRAFPNICDALMTPNNNVIVDRCGPLELYDINMQFIRQVTSFAGHMDIGRDVNGDEIVLIAAANDPSLAPGCENNGIEKIRLSDSQKTCLLPLYWDDLTHVSISQNGWVVVSNTDNSDFTPDPGDSDRGTANPPDTLPSTWASEWGVYFNEVTLVKLDGSEIRRLVHHRTRRFDDYWHQPRATISRDGKYVLFDSNFAVYPTGNYTDVYLVALNPSAQNVIWTNLVNVTVTGDTLQKTGGCDGCQDAGATSQQEIVPGDGYMEFTAFETDKYRGIGLSNGNDDTTVADIDFAILLSPVLPPNFQGAQVRENGVYRTETSYSAGDVFRVAVESGVVKYYRNGTVFYTSDLTPTFPLLVDTSLWNSNATIGNAVIHQGQ